jgi:hypothetical protein
MAISIDQLTCYLKAEPLKGAVPSSGSSSSAVMPARVWRNGEYHRLLILVVQAVVTACG